MAHSTTVGFGVLGAIMNSLILTKHAIESTLYHYKPYPSLEKFVNYWLIEQDPIISLGLLLHVVLALATWVPFIILVTKKFSLRLRMRIGIGVLGGVATTYMETHYAAVALGPLFYGAGSIGELLSRLTTNDIIFSGTSYFLMAVIATWVPWVLLTIDWCFQKYKFVRDEKRQQSIVKIAQAQAQPSAGN
jgi:hypothetical protein